MARRSTGVLRASSVDAKPLKLVDTTNNKLCEGNVSRKPAASPARSAVLFVLRASSVDAKPLKLVDTTNKLREGNHSRKPAASPARSAVLFPTRMPPKASTPPPVKGFVGPQALGRSQFDATPSWVLETPPKQTHETGLPWLAQQDAPSFAGEMAPQQTSPPDCSHWQSPHNVEMGCLAQDITHTSMTFTLSEQVLLPPRDGNSATRGQLQLLQQQLHQHNRGCGLQIGTRQHNSSSCCDNSSSHRSNSSCSSSHCRGLRNRHTTLDWHCQHQALWTGKGLHSRHTTVDCHRQHQALWTGTVTRRQHCL